MNIENVTLYGLIDTGANRSIINPRKFYSISEKLRPSLRTIEKQIVLANSEKISTLGETTLSLATSIGIFPQNLIVAEINEPLILGNDFLSQNRCLVDVANSCLHINGKTLLCTLESKVKCLFQ